MLKPTRKADQKEMAKQLAALGPHTLQAEGSTFYTNRGFHITLHAEHGLNASIIIDGDSRNCRDEAYVINWYFDLGERSERMGANDRDPRSGSMEGVRHPWHMDSKTTGRLSSLFEARLGPVNQFHRHKATSVVYGFDNVIDVVETGLAMCTDRSAFETESIHA